MRIFTASCSSYDVHGSSSTGTCVKRAYPGLTYEIVCRCAEACRSATYAERRLLLIPMSVPIKKWGACTIPCTISQICNIVVQQGVV
jgi:hypothetical protein